MKLKNLFISAAAFAMLAACSDENTPETGGTPTFEGDGYVAVKISLPTQPSTRAQNDNFDDGVAEEYKVQDACLVLFKGDSESTATIHSSYEITGFTQNDQPTNGQISTDFTKAVKVRDISLAEGEHLYGLVMVNYKNVAEVVGTDFHVGGNLFMGTFSELLEKTSNVNFTTKTGSAAKDYFFMTNAPLADKAGGITNPGGLTLRTLVELTGQLKDTAEDAEKNPAGTIYVERAVAKATLSVSATKAFVDQSSGEKAELEIESVEWVVDNTEPTSYIVRNTGSFNTWASYKSSVYTGTQGYRMVGSNVVGTLPDNTTRLYRTYWCIDPQYDKRTPTMNTTTSAVYSPLAKDGDKFKSGAAYCYENTFNVASMNYSNTTRAILKVKYKNTKTADGSLYTINGRDDQIFYYRRNATSQARAYVINDPAVISEFTALLKPNQTDVQLNDFIRLRFETGDNGHLKMVNVDIKDYRQNVGPDDPTFNPDYAGVDITDANLALTPFANVKPTLSENLIKDLIDRVNARFSIQEYKGGVSYYDLRFTHFGLPSTNPAVTDGADLTPWIQKAASSTDEAYAGNENDYLGRYGMVRNNWYDVNVSGFSHLGSPVAPDVKTDTTSDDNQKQEKWVAFTIKVLSWAKRVQNHEF